MSISNFSPVIVIELLLIGGVVIGFALLDLHLMKRDRRRRARARESSAAGEDVGGEGPGEASGEPERSDAVPAGGRPVDRGASGGETSGGQASERGRGDR